MLDIDTALPEGLCENEYLEGATQEVEAEMSEEAPKNDFNELEEPIIENERKIATQIVSEFNFIKNK